MLHNIFQICENGHVCAVWNSQPYVRGGMRVGNLLLCSNIVVSGNNFEKINLLLSFMNMGKLDQPTFSGIQSNILVPVIEEVFNEHLDRMAEKYKDKPVIIAGK